MQTIFKDGTVLVAGFLPSDAEYKTVGDKASSLTKFGLKVGERPPVGGEQHGEPIWVNCVCWHDVARAAATLKKFDVVMAFGKIKVEEYEGKTYKKLAVDGFFKMPSAAQMPTPAAPSNDLPIDAEVVFSDDGVPF